MGKARATRHQKFVKSEKAKVKLKQKKELPKGTNITNTSFKVKKIVVPEQLKTATNEPLSRYKLSLKELISRLQHFNTTSRKDALGGIKQLIGTNPKEILGVHVGQLISGVTPLVLDKEKSVRREAFQTLHYILSPLDTEKISPFFDILCSYLRCAMTHIDTSIHEDSVFYFDVLIDNAADLVAVNAHKIFPSFLDMISKLRIDSKPGRTLLVNLGSKMTSVKWRSKVLSRLLKFLKILNNLHLKSKGIVLAETDTLTSYYFEDNEHVQHNLNTKTVFYDKDQLNHFPLYKGFDSQLCFTKEKNAMNEESDNENQKLRSYTEVLLPLLFDTWLEVRPANSANVNVESVISEEAVVILKEILEIFLLTWNLLKLTDEHLQMTELTEWFVDKYQRSFGLLISNSFPYTQSIPRNKKKNHTVENTSGEKCLEENLMICHIYTILNCKIEHNYQTLEADRILNYIKWSLDSISDKNVVCQSQVVAILTGVLKRKNWIELKGMIPLLDTIVEIYTNGCGLFKEHIFTVLCNILLSDHLKALQGSPSFQTWLSNLPDAISKETTISEKSFDVIMRFAVQNNKLFNESIKSKLKSIVQNLPKVKLVDAQNQNEANKKIINLLYWVNCWDVNSLNMLQDQLESPNFDVDTKEYLVDILKLKTEGLFPV